MNSKSLAEYGNTNNVSFEISYHSYVIFNVAFITKVANAFALSVKKEQARSTEGDKRDLV